MHLFSALLLHSDPADCSGVRHNLRLSSHVTPGKLQGSLGLLGITPSAGAGYREEQGKGVGEPPALLKSDAVALLATGRGRDRQGGEGKQLALEPPGQEAGRRQERQQLPRFES